MFQKLRFIEDKAFVLDGAPTQQAGLILEAAELIFADVSLTGLAVTFFFSA